MDGDGLTPAAASEAAVLGDDDLLREILLRLGFPNYLVRAALVSKRWLLHVSDPAFLRRFRERHPARLLGFCVGYPSKYRFVPLPQPPELAAVSRRAASFCNDAFVAGSAQRIKHCRNGRLITAFFHEGRFRYSLLSPLLAEEPVAVLPPTPVPRRDGKDLVHTARTEIFLPEDGAGGSDGITLVNIWRAGGKLSAEVYVLRSGGWGAPATAATEFPPEHSGWQVLPPVHGKVFLMTTFGYTLGLDLAATSFFTLELPVGVGVGHNYKISCAEGSGLYLVNADGFQLSMWLHRMTGDNDGAGGWLLVDTFCVREAWARLAGYNWVSQDGDFVAVAAVGDNAEFVFLDHAASGLVLYVHLRSRVVEKVHDQHDDQQYFGFSAFGRMVSPLMMIWPPIFPALRD